MSIEFDKETKMAKVILICGKICSGKSTYAEQMRVQNHAALLSVDEITLALFGQHCGDKHDDYVERTQNYLFDKSLELIEAGINVVLDWGFWMKEERDYAREFYNGQMCIRDRWTAAACWCMWWTFPAARAGIRWRILKSSTAS